MLAFILSAAQSNAQQSNKKMKATSAHAPVNGISMYYEVYGNGDIPLVPLHGGGSTIQTSFENIIPFLATDHKVIAIEAQAHGRTTDRNTPESFVQDADDAATLLKHLNITKANFMGFSNGGTTALQIAIRHPELVNKIVVVAGAYQREGFMQGFFEFMPTATFESMPQQLKDAFMKVNPNHALLVNMFEKDKARMVNFKDISDDLIRGIKAPALFMVGDKDVITVEHTIKMSQLIAGAKLSVIPGIHGECIGEAGSGAPGSKLPQSTAILVNEFLGR
ncbi:alpha/beta hydrolase [Mucilaginibacter corticis]|uniref:Alpha/beta hydrolase n=2 Tax=Mucilaginibacter corticis TaxID=2597670 RepID=A0A556MMR3_9SPHI|nr:alpha/beta hydrolase [Mucilaginibacter corticis]